MRSVAPIARVALAVLLIALHARTLADSLWLSNGGPTPQAATMLDVLRAAGAYGLRPEDYALEISPADQRAILTGKANAGQRAHFDGALTSAVSRFAAHISRGRVSARSAGFDLPTDTSKPDPADIRQLATADDVLATLASLEPRARPYGLLKRVLSQYRELGRQPGLTKLPPLAGPSVSMGDEYPGAPKVRALLVALGDLDRAASTGHENEAQIDAALAEALRRFQARHGLHADGRIGRATYAALTVPMTHRVRQIELALERWRWLAALPRPDIVVNVPQFMLYALPPANQPTIPVIEMPVVVGRTHTRTPVFVASITQVIFQPFWDVPSSIVAKELLPRIRKDPGFLSRHHFEIVRGPGDDATVVEPAPATLEALAAGRLRLRQRPGPDNALGPVKFVLPNRYEVRLHGTPEQNLFEQSRRAFSHGCIRVSEPAVLAEYVLRNASGNWDAAAVDAAICGTKTFRVILDEPVRVVVFYTTAAATQSQGVLFSKDIYGHDARLDQLLRRPFRGE